MEPTYTVTFTEWERLQICLALSGVITELQRDGHQEVFNSIVAMSNLRQRLRDLKR